MAQKLIKINCNLTGETLSIYEDYYNKKVKQYGSEEILQKFYIKNKIISLLNKGHNLQDISVLLGFTLDENKKDYYEELVKFHYNGSLIPKIKSDSKTTFVETDPEVKKFINNWKNYVK